MLLKYKGILIIKLYKKSDHCLLKLDQLQVNSHWKLNLNCTLKKIAKAKICLVCRLCSTVRIVKKNTKSIFQFLPWSDLEIEPSKHQWNCLNGFLWDSKSHKDVCWSKWWICLSWIQDKLQIQTFWKC